MEIIAEYVFYLPTNEKISLEKLNKGLSDFYGQKVNISNENLKEFEGDIEALCFGFDN